MIKKVRMASLGSGVAYAALLANLLLTGCPAPGEGAKAEQGYKRAEPVIAALERFKKEGGSYPESLAQLPAEWLPAATEGARAATSGFVYKHRDGHFELTFSYGGPGVNHCRYDSAIRDAKRWKCHGYY